MLKYHSFLFTFIFLLFLGLFAADRAEANSVMNGTFVDVTYEEVQLDDETTEKRLKNITIMNEQGRTITMAIDQFTKLTVDTLPTTIDAFKPGMEVEADVNLRRVKELRGQSGEFPAEIEHRDRVITGTVNHIDPNGAFLSIRLDDGQSKTYYLNNETEIFKGTTLTDLSVLYEGDRVKLTFMEYNTNYISSIEINTQGMKVEHLYKGTIHQIDTIRNKLIIKNERVFRDGKWQPTTPSGNTSYTYSTKTPIYVGNQPIKHDRFHFYKNHDIYFVTVSQFGQEVIQKMVIKRNNERTFYEPMTSVNLSSNWLNLKTAGLIPYHDGTILIRNGRIVDEKSLQVQLGGTAFVVTDGAQKSQYANVVHVTNDGFQSPNLTNHSIYFGQISSTNGYQLSLKHAKLLSNNYWQNSTVSKLSFSNDTVAVEDFKSSVLTIVPQQNELINHVEEYGYFYVANNTIIGAHIVGTSSSPAQIVSVGRFDGFAQYEMGKPTAVIVRNVSQWQSGVWEDVGRINSMNIKQTTIIRDGKIIDADELKTGERLYILHESKVKGRILFVN
ncbi:hypothetical protein [Domibacillus aminovorans]|uniref:S1 motif domain-containing protein n=1 Tax=Domibacillus aminovorans TaxID=29332 RepID=A0A177L0K5_9BACI|nr:hypothetical protein [Domibacillus aminovorans]OAH58946.1 hypothetical protein AWH49_04585 [Domibacillus aminovorans]